MWLFSSSEEKFNYPSVGFPFHQHSNIFGEISHLAGLSGGNKTPFKDLCQRNKGKTVSKLMTEFGIILKMETKSTCSKYLSYFNGYNSVSDRSGRCDKKRNSGALIIACRSVLFLTEMTLAKVIELLGVLVFPYWNVSFRRARICV